MCIGAAAILLVGVLPCPVFGQGTAIKIGVPAVSLNTNWLEGHDPLAFVLQSALTDSLLHIDERGHLRFDLAGSLQRTGAETVKMKTKADAYFTNGRPVTGDDVAFSIERCRLLGILPQELGVVVEGISREWAVFSGKREQEWLGKLEHCPILEAESSRVFGKRLGTGTNAVGAGPYQILDYRRELLLRRVKAGVLQLHGEISIQAFPEAENGFMALRAGTIDLLFESDPHVLELAQKDETLLVSKCSIYMVVYRRGLNVRCDGALDTAGLGY